MSDEEKVKRLQAELKKTRAKIKRLQEHNDKASAILVGFMCLRPELVPPRVMVRIKAWVASR